MTSLQPTHRQDPRWSAALVVVAALLSVATSPSRYQYPRSFPVWTMTNSRHQLGCATVDVWISKSGKTGVGVSILASTSATQCQLELVSIGLEIAGHTFFGEPLISAPPVTAKEPIHFYSPIAFDNESHWNRDERDAVIAVTFVVDGIRSPVRVATAQRRKGNHDKIAVYEPSNLNPYAGITVSPDGIDRGKPVATESGETSVPNDAPNDAPLEKVAPPTEAAPARPTNQPNGPLEPVETSP